jgi:ketosteroid isomerase-like protein
MTATDTVTADAREIARRFVEAFNERDQETLRTLVAEDVELRTMSGGALRGHEGLDVVLRTAQERNLLLVPFRPPEAERDGDTVKVSVPIRELIGPDDIERRAEFEVRDGRVVAFAVRPFE